MLLWAIETIRSSSDAGGVSDGDRKI